MKKFLLKYTNVFAALALAVTAITANSACVFVTHQPEMPKGSKALRKF